jgi:hypothetical protein
MQIKNNEIDNSEFSQQEEDQMKEIEEILDSEKIEPTTALNILLSAINSSYDKEHFNDLDRALIAKALLTFKDLVDAGEDFIIKVK